MKKYETPKMNVAMFEKESIVTNSAKNKATSETTGGTNTMFYGK